MPPLKQVLRDISPNGNDTPTDDLANIASVFLGIWKGCDSKKRISLNEIVQKAEKFKYINLKIYSDESLSKACQEALDAIEDFEYHISGRMFCWKTGLMTGRCPWSEEMEKKITKEPLKDKWELISRLS